MSATEATWGQHGDNMGEPGVNLGSTRSGPGVKLGSSCGQGAAAYHGNEREVAAVQRRQGLGCRV